MRALVVDRSGAIALSDQPIPHYDGDVRIRVRAAGICGTDLQILEGYAGFSGIPGHEFVGIVERASSAADQAWIGKRVVGDINVGCGACEPCAAGVKEHCDNRTVLGIRDRPGAFAEYLSLPARNLHEVPDSVDDETAVFVEPTAAACRIFEQIEIGDRTSVAVVGDGRMGLIVAQVLRTRTPDVVVIGKHERKLDVARALGLNARRADAPATRVRYDIVVDVTGRAEGLTGAMALVRPRGTIVLKSTFHGEAALPTWPIVVDEVAIVGSRCGPFRPALDLLASGAVQVAPLVSRVAPLEDYASAFADAGRMLKILFRI